MGNPRMDIEDQESVFRSSYNPYPLYFVQSPSTASRANSQITYHLPNHIDSLPLHLLYSSSRGSDGSYPHEKKISNYDHQADNDEKHLINHVYGYNDDDSNEDEFEDEEEKGCVRLISFSTYPSSARWICLQILWRLIVSLGVALLVFYLATKPPPPHMSVKIAKIGEFELGEGADATGVTTKLLTINCSMTLTINNKSKFFRLQIQPPVITMSFGHLPLAIAYGRNNIYARSDDSTIFELNVATRSKPIYGGGRAMQDMLQINKGLPLVVQLKMRSSFRVVWGLIRCNFHHKAECLLLLGRAFDKKHLTQTYESRCLAVTS